MDKGVVQSDKEARWKDKEVLWWFGHVERMEKKMIAKRIYVGVCAGSRSVQWVGRGRDGLIP